MTAITGLLPSPASAVALTGSLDCSAGFRVVGDEPLAAATTFVLADAGRTPIDGAAVVHVAIDDSLAEEAYALTVAADGVRISAATAQGARWAAWTLLQLAADGTLPCCEIRDEPRLAWRGIMVDTARHFMPIGWLHSFVRQVAAAKYNRLQLHLSDDEGWRFESKRHPELHTVGGTRPRTEFPGLRGADETPHSGWYTQDELRELVAYAAALGVTVVPEISMPGHSGAWQTAMPQLAAHPEAFAEPRPWRVLRQALNLTPECLEVIGDVLDELADVFDSPWIHTGGDEVAGMAPGEQCRFTAWLDEQVRARGRIAATWDEAVEGCPTPGVLVTAWRGVDAVRAATDAGHLTVAAPNPTLYLDHRQHLDDPDVTTWGWISTWPDVLAYDPLAGLGRPELVVGSQCQLWAETLPTPRHVEVAAWPRAAAHAQAAWSGPSADPDAFLPALTAHLERLDRAGVAYRPFDGLPGWYLP